jgi:hypothetical protein
MKPNLPSLLASAGLLAFAQPAAPPAAYDLVVYEATPGGVACAVRAARQGLRVALVNHSKHLGGMLSGGIDVMDTLYEGSRAPLVDEVNARILGYYREQYGEDSPQYRIARPGDRVKHPTPKRLTFEPHVAERVIDQMIAAEKRITVFREYHPAAVERAERKLIAVRFVSAAGRPAMRLEAKVFADASYEGDLMATAGAAYRVGREDREEYGEPHAGRIFSRRAIAPGGKGVYPHEALEGALQLRPFQAVTQEIFAGSTGEGDDRVQAYHYRLTLTNNPANRRLPDKPSGYDRELVRSLIDGYRGLGGAPSIPNQKKHWFQNYSGGGRRYPTASWEERRPILDAHRAFALGAVYFLQNDPAIPDADRAKAREWGLPKDEFVDNDNFPYELYVREARRLLGRSVFTEHDATLARGFARAPIHADSIAVTDWFMDSHEVSTERAPGSDQDGKIILSELTRPAQIGWSTLLPRDLDNLLVPVCVSSTHVGWGAIRLEPTWIHIGEAAGYGAAMAVRTGRAPALLDAGELQRTLVESGVMIAFFNDLDMKTPRETAAAVQYFGARGFFASYDARPREALSTAVAREWARGFGELAAGRADANRLARAVNAAPVAKDTISARDFAAQLATALGYWNVGDAARPAALAAQLGLAGATISRADACRLMYALLKEPR